MKNIFIAGILLLISGGIVYADYITTPTPPVSPYNAPQPSCTPTPDQVTLTPTAGSRATEVPITDNPTPQPTTTPIVETRISTAAQANNIPIAPPETGKAQ